MSYLMSGMYALPLCVPINRAYKRAGFKFGCIQFIESWQLLFLLLLGYLLLGCIGFELIMFLHILLHKNLVNCNLKLFWIKYKLTKLWDY